MNQCVVRRSDRRSESEDVQPHCRPRDLLVFGEDWGGLPSSTQHFMTHLSRDRSIVWVNSIGMRRPHFSAADLLRAANKLRSGFLQAPRRPLPSPAPSSLHVLAPQALSWPGIKAIDKINATLLRRQILPILSARQIREPIVWASLPSAVVVLAAIEANKVVYYCGDDYSALPRVNARIVRDLEQRMVERADVIVAASEILADRFPAHKTIHVPHGVDVDLFGRPCAVARDLPRGRPVAGYYGSLAPWVDVAMLAKTAARMRDWDFVFIGPVSTDVALLTRMSNVKLLGPRLHSDLPSYSQHWDVSLLPSKLGAWANASNPLKLREYLAAGRPIASVSIPAIEPYKDLVSVADSTGFAKAIRVAAADQARNEARRSRVRSESWAARSQQLKQMLDRL